MVPLGPAHPPAEAVRGQLRLHLRRPQWAAEPLCRKPSAAPQFRTDFAATLGAIDRTFGGTLQRRTFMLGSAAALAGAALPHPAQANVATPYSYDLDPPTNSRDAFIKWAVEHRG